MTTSPDKTEQLIGTELLGRYLIEEPFSAGGMSALYKGVDRETGKQVAVRIMHSEKRLDKSAITRFQNAARAMQKLSHPHLTPILASGVTSTRIPFLVYEFIRGQSLRDEIAMCKRLDPNRAREIAIQCSSALQNAHAVGVVHRNIKPGNVLLRENETGKVDSVVTGFGIARQFQMSSITMANITQTKKVVGSPTYMSPEQFASANVDARSDIYSFGCLLYEMLAGHPPFHSSTYLATAAMHSFEWPESLRQANPDVPPWFESIVVACMKKDPGDRYQSMVELREDLEHCRCRFGEAVFAPTPAEPARSKAGSARSNGRVNKWLIASIIGSLACGAVVTTIMTTPNKIPTATPENLQEQPFSEEEVDRNVLQSENQALNLMSRGEWRAADLLLSSLLSRRLVQDLPEGKLSQLRIERTITFIMQKRYAEADTELSKCRLASNDPMLGFAMARLANADPHDFPLTDFYNTRLTELGYSKNAGDLDRLHQVLNSRI